MFYLIILCVIFPVFPALWLLPSIKKDMSSDADGMCAAFGCVGSFATLLAIFSVTFLYIQSSYKADYLNKTYGLELTADDIFYAEGVVDEVLTIQRKRYEVIVR